MSELHIFNLLRQLNNDFTSNISDCDNLIPERIKSASKSIADIIYETLGDKSSAGTSKRLDFIQLIRRLSHKDAHHYQPNDTNYAYFLNCIAPFDEQPDLLQATLNEQLRDCNVASSDEIVEFYRRRDDKLNERRNRLERIAQIDAEKLREINASTSKNVNVDFETLPDVLCRDESKRLDENARHDRVKLIYAISNVSHENDRRVRSMIDEITREEMSVEEINLIENLWKANASIVDAGKFRFLYEKPLLRICTQLVCATDLQNGSSLVDGFKREHGNIIEVCEKNRRVRNDVVAMLYTLFALSGYNENLFCVIKCFR